MDQERESYSLRHIMIVLEVDLTPKFLNANASLLQFLISCVCRLGPHEPRLLADGCNCCLLETELFMIAADCS